MDLITQGALGAILPLSVKKKWTSGQKYHTALAGFLGMIGGMSADLDVLINSDTDPLLFLTYHRHFTHSLIFIPIGGLIIGLLMHWTLGCRCQLKFSQTVFFCSLGYGTHALLDATTSYGTLLLWPFIDTRYSLNIISIIDPIFTLPLIISVSIAAIYNKPYIARFGLAWALLYFSVGYMQSKEASQITANLAISRGHTPLRSEVKPSFGNIFVWKSIYQTEGKFYIDAMRVGISPKIYEGTSIHKLNLARDIPWLSPNSQQAHDVERFDQFSDGFTSLDPEDPNRIFDVRYSFVPNEISPLFSIRLAPGAQFTQHVSFNTHRRNAQKKLRQLWNMIFK
tara:strand:- start:564 stop:1580 length:1017 start_codon:yes stop_codon:yes gene_type:complete